MNDVSEGCFCGKWLSVVGGGRDLVAAGSAEDVFEYLVVVKYRVDEVPLAVGGFVGNPVLVGLAPVGRESYFGARRAVDVGFSGISDYAWHGSSPYVRIVARTLLRAHGSQNTV